VVDNKEIRADRISLNEKFAVPCAESLGEDLARLGTYSWLPVAGSNACARDSLAMNIIDVMQDD
jgi:hypothetical protein